MTVIENHLRSGVTHLLRALRLKAERPLNSDDVSRVSQAIFDAFNGRIRPKTVLEIVHDVWMVVDPPRDRILSSSPPAVKNPVQ